jgi:hypothetical protein
MDTLKLQAEALLEQKGAWSAGLALALADSFSDACREGEAIPGWALALRALASRVNLAQPPRTLFHVE